MLFNYAHSGEQQHYLGIAKDMSFGTVDSSCRQILLEWKKHKETGIASERQIRDHFTHAQTACQERLQKLFDTLPDDEALPTDAEKKMVAEEDMPKGPSAVLEEGNYDTQLLGSQRCSLLL